MQASRWRCASRVFDVTRPIIMGICNVTPDSFSDGGLHGSAPLAIEHAQRMLAKGADIIDVGGESTRPGAEEVPPELELARVLPVVEVLAAQGVCVSIDTRHAEVAAACVNAGAAIVNDVSGFRSHEMRQVAAGCDVGLVVMHMHGTPKTMQQSPVYQDVVADVELDLLRMAERLQLEGVEPDRICLDFGIGFGKNAAHNQELAMSTARFANLGYPLMAAVSRKSFIGGISGEAHPASRDVPSALCTAFMVGEGATIARVHNVAMTRRVLETSRRAVIGLGSNMGNAASHIDDALNTLRLEEGVWIGKVSQLVQSEPAYLEDQEGFVNAVAVIQTVLSPYELLHLLQRIENEMGRVRTVANGPRTIDLDIVDYEGVVLDKEELTLPHPLALERDFVVTPLLDVAPDYELANGMKVTHDHVSVGRITGLA